MPSPRSAAPRALIADSTSPGVQEEVISRAEGIVPRMFARRETGPPSVSVDNHGLTRPAPAAAATRSDRAVRSAGPVAAAGSPRSTKPPTPALASGASARASVSSPTTIRSSLASPVRGQRAGGATHGAPGAPVEAVGGAPVGVVAARGADGVDVGPPDPCGAAVHAASARAARATGTDAQERRTCTSTAGGSRRRRRALLTVSLQHVGRPGRLPVGEPEPDVTRSRPRLPVTPEAPGHARGSRSRPRLSGAEGCLVAWQRGAG